MHGAIEQFDKNEKNHKESLNLYENKGKEATKKALDKHQHLKRQEKFARQILQAKTELTNSENMFGRADEEMVAESGGNMAAFAANYVTQPK